MIRRVTDGICRLDATYPSRRIYLEIIAGNEKPPFKVLLKNLPILLKVMVTASSRIRALVIDVLKNPHLDPNGFNEG